MAVYSDPILDADARSGSDPPRREIHHWLDLSTRLALTGPSGPFDLDVALAVDAGSFVALVGPSGAGKTTLLRLMAGLAKPDAGYLRVAGSLWCDASAQLNIPTRRRSIGFVFQDYALFPNMTVRRNVEYAFGSRPQPDEVQKLLELVKLEGLGDAYPARLSGGQKQRLALVRALARRPSILMLDEPLSALDPAMRRQIQDELKRLHRSFGTTTFMVSHDVSEILRLADRVVRLEQGRIVFDGKPENAFGTVGTAEGICVLGQHVSGPDAAGYATVSVDGQLHQLRYRNFPTNISTGDAVLLRADEVTAQRPL